MCNGLDRALGDVQFNRQTAEGPTAPPATQVLSALGRLAQHWTLQSTVGLCNIVWQSVLESIVMERLCGGT